MSERIILILSCSKTQTSKLHESPHVSGSEGHSNSPLCPKPLSLVLRKTTVKRIAFVFIAAFWSQRRQSSFLFKQTDFFYSLQTKSRISCQQYQGQANSSISYDRHPRLPHWKTCNRLIHSLLKVYARNFILKASLSKHTLNILFSLVTTISIIQIPPLRSTTSE